ncbi:MAG TPA: hypothetical protein VD833_07945 [Vicinamibacterales bacterium]|nr:hypothetical protein [Vicinamibacterales bacterium]
MRSILIRLRPRHAIAGVALLTVAVSVSGQSRPYRTLNDRFPPPPEFTRDQWARRAAYLREHVLVSAGLLPMPERAPLRSEIFGTITHTHYSVSKVYFESIPGFYVTGNLYRPAGQGPFPAILSPHGHWAYGRLENTPLNSGPGRAIGLARQGFVVFSHDMIGYNDSRQLPHTFDGRRARLWGLSLAGLQLWNSIRALDFLESLPDVRRDAIGVTGESGGGTQTFLLAAVDPRVAVAAPVNMISLHMQGGCLCENPPGLRLETTNVEIAAAFAPRPLLMISATGDWTKETMEVEYPAVQRIYRLFGAEDRVHAVRVDAEHNYNRESRETMYAWMARWLKDAPPETRIAERSFTPDPLQDLLVFHGRPLPPGALTPDQLTERWIQDATAQLAGSPAGFAVTLRHVLGFAGDAISDTRDGMQRTTPARGRDVVLVASTGTTLPTALTRAGFDVRPVSWTLFEAEGAAGIRHFQTYNLTAAAQRVADIAAAIRANPGAPLVADGTAALAALLAAAVAHPPLAVLDLGRFDRSNDDAFLEHLEIPGLRRAGDLQTAASMTRGRLVLHNAGDRSGLKGPEIHSEPLGPNQIAGILRKLSR